MCEDYENKDAQILLNNMVVLRKVVTDIKETLKELEEELFEIFNTFKTYSNDNDTDDNEINQV